MSRDPSLLALRDLAASIAREAGELLIAHQSRILTVETKSSTTDPVSEADRASEALISERLAQARPDDGFLGEEQASNRVGTSGLRWVVDPLDATVNYLYGIPHWAVSIACEDAEGSAVGVVFDPAKRELFMAARGHGAHLVTDAGVAELAVTTVPDLGQTMVATGFAYDQEVRAAWAVRVADLIGAARDVRRLGSAALDLAYVAAGRVDVYVESGLGPWDWAAGTLLVSEAGGTTTRTSLEIAGTRRDGWVAGGRAAHDHVLGWLREDAP